MTTEHMFVFYFQTLTLVVFSTKHKDLMFIQRKLREEA